MFLGGYQFFKCRLALEILCDHNLFQVLTKKKQYFNDLYQSERGLIVQGMTMFRRQDRAK